MITPYRNVNSGDYCGMPSNDFVLGSLSPQLTSTLTAKKNLKYSINGASYIQISAGATFIVSPNQSLVCLDP